MLLTAEATPATARPLFHLKFFTLAPAPIFLVILVCAENLPFFMQLLSVSSMKSYFKQEQLPGEDLASSCSNY